MTAPRGPGQPGSIDAMIKKRQAEDRLKDEAERKKRQRRNRLLIKLGTGLVIGVVTAAATLWYMDSRKGCGANERRRDALAVVMEQGDPEAGTLIKERFPDKKAYRCAEHAGPRGILVSVSEDSGDPIVWFVDNNGTPLNVNLLAVSWTPKLGPAPTISEKNVAKVLK